MKKIEKSLVLTYEEIIKLEEEKKKIYETIAEFVETDNKIKEHFINFKSDVAH